MIAYFLTALILCSTTAPPNVVFLSVDALRADHLGCYGYSLPTSPHIDALAERGLAFDDCVCMTPLTAPSFASMLTSRNPRSVGVVRNGLSLPETVTTVPELFRAAGYQTFCVQSNWTLKARLARLQQGFDVYDDDFHQRRWGVLKSERSADEVTQRALKCLQQRDPNRPFFAWFHYSDPHAPYRFHPDFNPLGRSHERLGPVERTRAKYDSEVAFTDHWIGRLLEALPQENTFIVFVADHGESLFDHDYLGHGRRLHQTSLHIPFVVIGPGIVPGRSRAPVCGLDVGPALLGIAGIAPASGMIGLDPLRAIVPSDRVRFVETYGGAVPRIPGARSLMAGRAPLRMGMLSGDWKLIVNARFDELYRLDADPAEMRNLAAEECGRVERMKDHVRAWAASTPRREAPEAPLAEDDFKALKNLGYLE